MRTHPLWRVCDKPSGVGRFGKRDAGGKGASHAPMADGTRSHPAAQGEGRIHGL